MFSSRSDFDLSPNLLTQSLERLRQQRHQIIDLTLSNPTAVGLRYPVDQIATALASADAQTYRPDPLGLEAARRAVQRLYLRRRVQVDLQDIVLTASTSEAYAYLFKLLADPGDRILVPVPSYPLFRFLAALESVEVVPYPLYYADDWYCDLAELDRLATKAQPCAVLTVHPNNPTGSYTRDHELRFIREVCRRVRAAVICDEVFKDFPLEESDPADAAADESLLTFVLNGLSKTLLLPQLKLGWIVIRGPEESRAAARERLELIADTFLSVNATSQVALPRLLECREELQTSALQRLKGNLEHLKNAAAGTPVRSLRVGGGWSAVLRLPPDRTDEEWCLCFLEEHGVLAHPGSFFGFPTPDHVVLSLLPEPDIFSLGIQRLLESCREDR